MATDSSATVRREAPHAKQTTKTTTIMDALTRRAQAILNDNSIDPQSRAIIRYAMEIDDPWLAELVRRADAGERLFDTVDFSQEPDTNRYHSIHEKVEALVEMICRAGDEPETKSAAMLVLMATLENSTHPKALANTAKHLAFARCGELNLYGMVEEQVATVEREMFEGAV